jgi:LemA protein
MLAALTPTQLGLLIAFVGILAGWALATWLGRQDRRTYILSRAPELPVRALSTHDDAWLRGRALLEEPLVCPWFDAECIAFSYRIEDKKTRTVRDSKGRTRTKTYWATVHSEDESRDFVLDDGDTIQVALREGENEAWTPLGTDYQGSRRRHTASVLEPGRTVSVLGVRREAGDFGPLEEVPLLVTFKDREQRVARAESKETWIFAFALLLPALAGTAAVAVGTEVQAPEDWLLPGLTGLGVLALQWTMLSYNRFIRLRHQVREAQRQVEIELTMRADLVPNLVTVVKGAAAHERGLAERIAGEEQAQATVRRVLLLHESVPELSSSELYLDLHGRLWALEEKLAHARRHFNDSVTEWNTRTQSFPGVLLAKVARFEPSPLFAAEPEEALPPQLDLAIDPAASAAIDD